MKTQLLPDEDHVGRLCRTRTVSNGKVTSEAFALRLDRDERELSVNWVECRRSSKSKRNIEGCKERLKKYALNPQYVAILKISDIREIECKTKTLDVVDTASRSNPCHCSITGLDMEQECYLAQQELADLANNNPIHWLEVQA